MTRSVTALLVSLGLLALAGCSDVPDQCDAICARFVTECGFTAWSGVDQCAAGCVEDMYRRDDSEQVLACYHAAVDAPTRAAAEARVDRAIEAGLFDQPSVVPFDKTALVDEAMDSGTCDLFAVIQCKVEAVQVPASGALLGE